MSTLVWKTEDSGNTWFGSVPGTDPILFIVKMQHCENPKPYYAAYSYIGTPIPITDKRGFHISFETEKNAFSYCENLYYVEQMHQQEYEHLNQQEPISPEKLEELEEFATQNKTSRLDRYVFKLMNQYKTYNTPQQIQKHVDHAYTLMEKVDAKLANKDSVQSIQIESLTVQANPLDGIIVSAVINGIEYELIREVGYDSNGDTRYHMITANGILDTINKTNN